MSNRKVVFYKKDFEGDSLLSTRREEEPVSSEWAEWGAFLVPTTVEEIKKDIRELDDKWDYYHAGDCDKRTLDNLADAIDVLKNEKRILKREKK